MSYIEDIARNALTRAHSDLSKAQRALVLVAGLLALVHLLTVQPYLRVAQDMAEIERKLAVDETLLASLGTEIERISAAQKDAEEQLGVLLKEATDRMIDDFTRLRLLVKAVSTSDRPIPDLLEGFENPGAERHRQVQAQFQRQRMEQRPVRTRMQLGQASDASRVSGEHMLAILGAIRAGAPDAYEQLTLYARSAVVEPAYADAHGRWAGSIRPAYLSALASVGGTARDLAEQASLGAAEEADALRMAADELAAARQVLEAMRISHDSRMDEALGTDWWHTVEGKERYADAVARSIEEQMDEIAGTSAAPVAAIERMRARQQTLKTALVRQRKALEAQFDAQSKQLATLSGATGVLPVDLATFIGIFPLVLGVVAGLLMLRVGQARHDAARSAEELALAAPEDRETRQWLTRRVLGRGGVAGPFLSSALVTLGACLWIALAATQLLESPVSPPISARIAAAVGIVLVLAAAAWNLWAIRLLDRALRR